MFSIDQLQLLPPSKWEDLENLVKDLFRAEWQDFHTQRHGRQGQSQQGVDVFGRPAAVPGWAGVQCKNKDLLLRSQLTVKELRQEVKKAKAFQPPLGQFVIATIVPRDGRLQHEARIITDRHLRRGEFSVHVYAWDDIKELLAKHQQVAMQYYGSVAGVGTNTKPPLLPETARAAAFGAPKIAAETNRPAAAAPLVLSTQAARALGILATSPLPLPEEGYRSLFPDIDWKAALPTLTAAKAVCAGGSCLQVPKPTKESFLPTEADSRPYLDTWIAALEPLREHVDMALFLSMQYLARHEYGKAVDALVELAPGLEPGMWNELYCSVLQAYNQPRLLKRLSGEQRIHFFYAYGLCLTRHHRPQDALTCIARMRRESKRTANHWGLAESFLLAGIAHAGLCEFDKAAQQYLHAATHARRHRMPLLVGHALHNLALLVSDTDPADAAQLLEKSIRAKHQARDEPGRVGGMIGRGIIAARQGQHAQAQKWFVRAEKIAARMDMRYARAVALSNIGSSLVDQDRPDEAISHYKVAQKLAEEEGFTDTLALSLGGEAHAQLALNRFARAHGCYIRLHQLRTEMEQHEDAVIALHDAGVCLLKQRKSEEARQTMRQALAEAHQYGVLEWAYRCSRDIALTYAEDGDPNRAVASLREAAIAEQDQRRFTIAARLWESVGAVLEEQSGEASLIEDAFRQAISALDQQEGSVDEQPRLLSGLHVCCWSSLAFERAIDALSQMERIARKERRQEALCRALDQRGTCLQELGRPADAISDHRAALVVARRLPDTVLAEHCLSNLGEALRKTNRTAAAIRAYRQAEAFARARGDRESAILTAHNRALALEDAARYGEAARVLRSCRDAARKLGIWDQYARALHGLANHAWLRSKPDAAVRLYRKALTEAKKHNVSEQIAPISLNYANALRYQQQPRRALRVLQEALEHFHRLPDAHDFLAELASVAAEIGELPAAKDYWTRARQHAVLVGDAAGAAQAYAGLAAILEQEGDFTHADQALQEALNHQHPPEEEALLLKRRLGVLLKDGNPQKAGKVFARLRALTEEHGLHEEAIDAHMLVGDHEWESGKSHTEAVKAYTAALAKSFELGLEIIVQVGVHTVQRLLSLGFESRLHHMDRIERSLETWLNRQTESERDAASVGVLLWPLRLARQVTLAAADGRTLSADQIADFLRDELFESAKRRNGRGRSGETDK